MAYRNGMNTIRTLALAITLVGCDKQEESGRADEVRLWYFDNQTTHAPPIIEEAEEILGMDLVISDDPEHSIVVVTWASLKYDVGQTAIVHECGRVVMAGEFPRTLAHELGHALGLGHVDDLNNLMSGEPSLETDLTDEQVDTMRWSAWWILEKCDRDQ